MTARDAQFWSGFDALPSQVAVLDETGDIVFTNRAWREFAADNGTADRDHVGTNYVAVCEASDDEEASRVAERLRALLDGERETVSVEYFCRTPEGDRWFTMRAERFERRGEEYVLVMHVDITDRKETELEVRTQNQRLETLAGLLSHDLRNPLNVALGRAEMVESEHADPLVRSLERMESIISDALTLVRPGEVRTTGAVDLESAARRAWDQVETGEAELSVVDSTTFQADPNLLANVFENCFRNAVEHGGDAVVVGPIDGDQGFYVSDDGRGISAADRERVFDYGYTTGEGGTGLGLSIVRRVVDLHGWDVGVTESERDGARFEVRF